MSILGKVAFITGIGGQDGSYLAKLLLDKGYIVTGLIRRSSNKPTTRLEHIFSKINLYYGDMTDGPSLRETLTRIASEFGVPDEIYHLAAQSHVRISFDMPTYTSQADAIGTLNILEAIRNLGWCNRVRFYNAATSELYGKVHETPQKETTPFHPRSPYAVAKLYAYYMTQNYREAYDMFACSGILFNHESPRRGHNFVTKKIIDALKSLDESEHKSNVLQLGNLNARRDWSHAKDMVVAMWLMLQQDKPKDYVCSSDKTTSVRAFVEKVWYVLRPDSGVKWVGKDECEKGYDKNTGLLLVEVNDKYFRPSEVELLLGDSTLARRELNWVPEYDLDMLIKDMVENDQ